jgi:hypothetical protein
MTQTFIAPEALPLNSRYSTYFIDYNMVSCGRSAIPQAGGNGFCCSSPVTLPALPNNLQIYY